MANVLPVTPPNPPQDVDLEQVEKDILGALDVYNSMAIKLRTTLVILGIIGTSFSLFVSTFLGDFEQFTIKIISYISSLSLALLSYFSVGAKGNNARNAWRHLKNAYVLYKTRSITILELVKAYAEAEVILGETNFTYEVPDRNKKP